MTRKITIRQISSIQLQNMLHNYTPHGRFLAKEGHTWIAVDKPKIFCSFDLTWFSLFCRSNML